MNRSDRAVVRRRAVPAAALLLLWTVARAQELPALAPAAAPTAAPAAPEKDDSKGVPLSIESTTQGNFGKLGIGAGYMGAGVYLDENGARKNGVYASLSIAVDGAPDQYTHPDVHEGENLVVGGYRIRVDKIVPAAGGKGTVVLTVWSPPHATKAARSWRRFFGF